MTNISQYIKNHLTAKSMWDEQADEVIGTMKKEDAESPTATMVGRWSDEAEGYPIQVLAVLLLTADRTALEWIDANKPQAWFRPMFALQDQPA